MYSLRDRDVLAELNGIQVCVCVSVLQFSCICPTALCLLYTQMGEYFGWVVITADLNGDG